MKRCLELSKVSFVALVACCLILLGGTAHAQIQGFVDSQNGSTFAAWNNSTLTLGGWAAAVDDTLPAKSIQILIDNKLVGTVSPSIARTDVAAYLGSVAYTNSGWTFSYNVGTKYPAGSHSLAVLAFDAEGNSVVLPTTNGVQAGFTIATPQPPVGFLDNIAASTVAQNQNIVISGWAGDPQDGTPVKQVQVLMDGTAVGNATLGGTRADVAAVYPTYLKSGWTFTYSAAKLAGAHIFTAVAYDNEGLNTALSVIAQNTVSVLAPDLTVASVGVTGTPASGGSITLADTTTNSGNGAATGSYTIFYLSTDGVTKGTTVGQRYVSSLAAGASSSGATTLTVPLNTVGAYYILACANGTNTNVESNITNNCVASAQISVAGADLTVASVGVTGAPASGGSITVSDTTTNSGGTAGGSYTLFYLSTDGVTKGTTVGQRYVSSLAAGAISTGTTIVKVPLNTMGTYRILACANGSNSVVESNTTNNCMASAQFSVAGADLTVSAVSTNPAAVLPGGTMAISDTTANALASAGGSYTLYYLSRTTTLVTSGSGAATLLGQRYVSALAASTTSTGTVNVAIASNTAPGTYYLFACANGSNSVVESNITNNCMPTPVAVYTAANAVFVDQNNANAANKSCGTSAIPCVTITEGLAAAKSGFTVLVNPGTYAEQLNIAQNVTLASTTKNTAFVQAPPVLATDPATGYTLLVNVTGGATNVSIVNMGVRGPGPSSCGSIGYGVYVGNANATLVGNQVLAIRDNPYSGCQNGVAIRFGSRALGYIGHTGTIAYNTVLDYNKGGIVVDGDGTNVNVLGNVVTGQNQAGTNGQNGIQISRGALGLVNGNVVSNNLYAAPPTPLNISADGILVYDVVGGVTVTNNTVTGNDEGIGIYSDTTAATNITVENNTVNKNAVVGIHADMYSTGNTIWMNTAQNNGVYDLADEHSDLSSNNWDLTPTPPYTVVTPSDSNTYGTVNVLPFSY